MNKILKHAQLHLTADTHIWNAIFKDTFFIWQYAYEDENGMFYCYVLEASN